MFFKIVIFSFSLLASLCLFMEYSNADKLANYTYFTGLFEAVPQRPVVVDLNNEKVFYSRIKFTSDARHEVFYDLDSQAFIIIRIKEAEYVEVFLAKYDAEVLSSPIFSTQSIGRYSHSRTVWSQNSKTLCFTGQYHKQTNSKRNLTLTCLKFNGSKVMSKTFNLSNFMYSHTGIWTVSDKLLITGRGAKSSHDKGEKPEIHLFMNLDDWSTKKDIVPSSQRYSIVGQFDQNSLAVYDKKSIFMLNSEGLKKIGDFWEGLGRIYGASMDNNRYFAQIYVVKEEDGFQYEKKLLALVPYKKNKKYRELFGGKYVGAYNASIYTSTPLNLNFTDKILHIE